MFFLIALYECILEFCDNIQISFSKKYQNRNNNIALDLSLDFFISAFYGENGLFHTKNEGYFSKTHIWMTIKAGNEL